MKQAPYSAIHRYKGWWFISTAVDSEHNRPCVGQILAPGDVSSAVILDDGSGDWSDDIPNSVLLDARLTRLYTSHRAALKDFDPMVEQRRARERVLGRFVPEAESGQ